MHRPVAIKAKAGQRAAQKVAVSPWSRAATVLRSAVELVVTVSIMVVVVVAAIMEGVAVEETSAPTAVALMVRQEVAGQVMFPTQASRAPAP